MKIKMITTALATLLVSGSLAANSVQPTSTQLFEGHASIVAASSGFGGFTELNSTTFLTSLAVDQYAPLTVSLQEPESMSSVIDAYGRANVQVSVVSHPQNGELTLAGNSQLTYSSDVEGSDKFILNYTAFGSLIGNIIVNVNVGAATPPKPNQLPVVKDIGYETQGGAISFDPTLNDYDPDGDALTLVLEPNQPNIEHGTLTQNGNTLTYTPYNDGFSGTEIVYYRVTDIHGAVSKEWRRALIQVRSSSGQIMNSDAATVAKGQSVTIDVLANDLHLAGYSVDVAMWSQDKVFEIVNNQIQYNAASDYTGIVYLYYTLKDSAGNLVKWPNGNTRYGEVYIAVHD